MIVESMNDSEFTLEVIRDYLSEMKLYPETELVQKGTIDKRYATNYLSKRGNQWFIVYRPEFGGQYSLHVKRIKPKKWFTWYSLILAPNCITLFGFNKHVAERISERYHPELTPSDALKEMLTKTPAIIQSEIGDQFYTRVNGGICIGSVYGKLISVNLGKLDIKVEIRDTKTFIADEQLFDDQTMVTDESIMRAINLLGKNYLSDLNFN